MIDASSSLTPSRVKTAPRPALKRGVSSRRVTAWVATWRALGRRPDEGEEGVEMGVVL